MQVTRDWTERPHVLWTEEEQPFGYAGVTKLFKKLQEALDTEGGDLQ